MAINLLPPEELSKMTNNPSWVTQVPNFMPPVAAQASNILGTPAAAPDPKPVQEPNDIGAQMRRLHQSMPAAAQLPAWDFEKNFGENAASVYAQAQKTAAQYEKSKEILGGINQMRLDQATQHFQEQQARAAAFHKTSAEHIRQSKERAKQLSQMKIDPSRYFKNKGTWASILGLISTAASGISMLEMGMDPNQALVGIENAIEQDIEAQKVEMGLMQDYNKTMDQLEGQELDLLIKGLNVERNLYSDYAGMVSNEIDELATNLDNSLTKNVTINFAKDFLKHAMNKDAQKAKAMAGAMDLKAKQEAKKARNQLLQQSNQEASKTAGLGYYGYMITDADQEPMSPFNVLRQNGGKFPPGYVVLDPSTGQPVKDQARTKGLVLQDYNTGVQKSQFYQLDAQGDSVAAKAAIGPDRVQDFNEEGIAANRKFGGDLRVQNMNGQTVYIQPSGDKSLVRQNITQWNGVQDGIIQSGKVIEMAQDFEKLLSATEMQEKDLMSIFKRITLEGPNQDVDLSQLQAALEPGKLEKLGAFFGLSPDVGTKLPTLIGRLDRLKTQLKVLSSFVVPVATGQKPGMRVSDKDLERSDEISGAYFATAWITMKNDPTRGMEMLKNKIIDVLIWHLKSNNVLSEGMLADRAMGAASRAEFAGKSIDELIKMTKDAANANRGGF